MKINTPKKWREEIGVHVNVNGDETKEKQGDMVSETDEREGGEVAEELSPRPSPHCLSRRFFFFFFLDPDSGFLAEMLDGIGAGPTASPHPGCFRTCHNCHSFFLTFTQMYLLIYLCLQICEAPIKSHLFMYLFIRKEEENIFIYDTCV